MRLPYERLALWVLLALFISFTVLLFASNGRISPVLATALLSTSACFAVLSGTEAVAFLSFKSADKETPSVTWVASLLGLSGSSLAAIISFAAAYRYFGVSGQNGTVHLDRVDAMYFSVVTWTTLGYGDYAPLGMSRLFASMEALLGYVTMAILVGVGLKIIPSFR